MDTSGTNGTCLTNLIAAANSARALGLSFVFLTVALCLHSVVALPHLSSGIEALKFSWNARLILCMANVSDRPRTSVTPISSEPLPDNPQKRITALVDFPPDAYSPEHHHEASLYVYVLKGEIRSQPRMVTNEIMDKVVIAGTPTQVTDKLIELSEVGLRWPLLYQVLGPDRAAAIRLVAEKVRPAFMRG